MAISGTISTLIVVRARQAIARVPIIALAGEAPDCVGARGIGIATTTVSTLVDIRARDTIARVSIVAFAGEAPVSVGARSVSVAVVQ